MEDLRSIQIPNKQTKSTPNSKATNVIPVWCGEEQFTICFPVLLF